MEIKEKAIKIKERELKVWDKTLQKKDTNLSEVTQELAAARVYIEKIEYEKGQDEQLILKHSLNRYAQNTEIPNMLPPRPGQSDPPPNGQNTTQNPIPVNTGCRPVPITAEQTHQQMNNATFSDTQQQFAKPNTGLQGPLREPDMPPSVETVEQHPLPSGSANPRNHQATTHTPDQNSWGHQPPTAPVFQNSWGHQPYTAPVHPTYQQNATSQQSIHPTYRQPRMAQNDPSTFPPLYPQHPAAQLHPHVAYPTMPMRPTPPHYTPMAPSMNWDTIHMMQQLQFQQTNHAYMSLQADHTRLQN